MSQADVDAYPKAERPADFVADTLGESLRASEDEQGDEDRQGCRLALERADTDDDPAPWPEAIARSRKLVVLGRPRPRARSRSGAGCRAA